MKELITLVEDHEDWLVDRVVQYAVEQKYTEYSSTLREAWRGSIRGLSEPLVAILDDLQNEERRNVDVRQAAVDFGVKEARAHRPRGVGLTQFVGLIKLYRRAYLDLLEEKASDAVPHRWMANVLIETFDAIELGIARDWEDTNVDSELTSLHEKNRN